MNKSWEERLVLQKAELSGRLHPVPLELVKRIPDRQLPHLARLIYIGYDCLSLTARNTYTLDETLKKGGRVVATFRQVVSRNGKTRTATQTTGTNARGQAVHDVLVFDKQ